MLHDRRWRCASDAETEQPTRAPEKFARVFLLQLIYKTLWLLFVFVPRAIHGVAPGYAWVLAGVFASYVILDVIALPFASLLARPTTSR